MSEDWLTTQEAATISGYHPNSIRRLISSGKINGRKFGPVWQVSRASLQTYMEQIEKLGNKRGPKTSGTS